VRAPGQGSFASARHAGLASWLLVNLVPFGEDRSMARKLLVRAGVLAAAMTLVAGCGSNEQLRPQPRPDPSPGYDVTALLPARSGLRVGAEVTIGHARAGRVTRVEVDGSQLIATLHIMSRYAPLDVDTQGVVRRTSSAPRHAYMALIPGHHGSPLADQTRLPRAR
jgi:ABC-type transporter Mla subunit MlaD